jgi:amino acid transporter
VKEPVIERSSAGTGFGYKQELKRSLSLPDLLAYGLVFIVPIAPVSVFGIVFNASHGMVPLVYVVGLIGMIFIALSYMAMAKAFPFAGSVYAYASRALGPTAGFFAGWAILLDYILIPTANYVVSAVALVAVFPGVPKTAVIVVMVVAATVVNFLGIESTARTSFVLLGFQVVVLVLFVAAAGAALAHHVAGARISFAPFYNPADVTPGLVFGALSIAVLSFLGFDAISTLSEESRGGAKTIGQATMLALCIAALLFVAQTWVASLFLLGRKSLPPGDATDAAFYGIAALVGGPVLKFLLAVPGAFLASLAGGVTGQAATARLLFGMARDGELPRALAHVDPRRKVPARAIIAVAAVTMVTGLALAEHLELVLSMVSFGALLGFLSLQISVIAYFVYRQGSRDWLRHLVTPGIGFAIIAYVLWNADANAKLAGALWMVAGLAFYLARKRSNRPAHLPGGASGT